MFAHSAVQCLTAIAQHHGIPTLPERLVHDYVLESEEPPTRLLIRMATELGLKAQAKTLRWVSNKGFPASLPLPGGWLTVRSALELPEVDNSRLTNPWKRSKFTCWMDQCPDEEEQTPPEAPTQASLF